MTAPHRLDHRTSFTGNEARRSGTSGQADQLAGAPFGQAAFARKGDLLARACGLTTFRRLISLSVEISSSRSASSRLSFAFSASKAQPPHVAGLEFAEVLAPDVDGLLADLVLLGRFSDEVLSASRRIATIALR